MSPTSPELVIAGGGLAGAAAACILAQAGREVLLIERQAGPAGKICGEFLSGEAVHYLARLDVDVAALGGHRIDTVRLVRGERDVAVTLPFRGYGLSRRVLDEVLLRRAADSGATVRRGGKVALRGADPLILLHEALGELRPGTLFLATGKHDLRGLQRPARPDQTLVGFKQHFRLAAAQQAALAGHVELIMLRGGGYAGLQRVEDGMANLCLLTPKPRLEEAGGSWDLLLAALLRAEPHLRRRLGSAAALAEPIAIYRVPYGHVHRQADTAERRVFRLGDQMAVIPSFTGDGMSIALHSAFAAAEAYLAGRDAGFYHDALAGRLRRQIGRASAMQRLASSWLGQRAMMGLAGLWPGGVRLGARVTRVSVGY